MNEAARAAPDRGELFSRGVAPTLLIVGVAAFVSLGVLLAFGSRMQSDGHGGANALSRSAVGYAGVLRLLRDTDQPVALGRGPSRFTRSPGLLVLTPPATAQAADIAKLLAGGGDRVLLVAPKWDTTADARRPGWVSDGGLNNVAEAAAPLKAAGAGIAIDGGVGVQAMSLRGQGPLAGVAPLTTGPVRSLRTVMATGGQTLLSDAEGDAVLVRTAGGVMILSDPDLLDNLGMADARTAASATALLGALDAGRGPIMFDVSLNGFETPKSLLGLALAPPFLGATLCLFATALLMGAHAAVRFGPVRREARSVALGKAALLDNSAMLISLARREPAMGRRYAALVRATLGRRSSRSGKAVAGAPDDAALDRMAPHAQPPFSVLADEAERARDLAALMRATRALHQRQSEILGEAS